MGNSPRISTQDDSQQVLNIAIKSQSVKEIETFVRNVTQEQQHLQSVISHMGQMSENIRPQLKPWVQLWTLQQNLQFSLTEAQKDMKNGCILIPQQTSNAQLFEDAITEGMHKYLELLRHWEFSTQTNANPIQTSHAKLAFESYWGFISSKCVIDASFTIIDNVENKILSKSDNSTQTAFESDIVRHSVGHSTIRSHKGQLADFTSYWMKIYNTNCILRVETHDTIGAQLAAYQSDFNNDFLYFGRARHIVNLTLKDL